jgi:ElaB/YqjD/DUF883 family membrane-anchored ribosome-binding protein
MPQRKGKIGEAATMGAPVPKEVADKDKKVVSAPQPESEVGDIGALRKEVDSLKAKVADAAKKVKSRATGIAQQTEATVRLRPVPALLIAAAAATAVALLVSRATVVPRRSRYRRLLDDLQERMADLRMLR